MAKVMVSMMMRMEMMKSGMRLRAKLQIGNRDKLTRTKAYMQRERITPIARVPI